MKTRRDFLKLGSLAVAGGMIAPRAFALDSLSAPASKTIGIQLYSLRGMIGSAGIQSVLETVAAIGYKNLETAGYGDGKIYGLDPKDFRKRVSDLGMKCTSAHLGQSYSKEKQAEVMAWWDKAIEAHLQAGITNMIQPSMPVNDKSKLDELKVYCDYFNSISKKTAASGIPFGFHNHTVEFKKIGDEVILDYMIANTDPASMIFELDVYWCQRGGADPVDYLKKYADRIRLVHIKDAKEIGASGEMDFKSIFKQMRANEIVDWYVEIEEYTNNDPVASAKQSFEYLDSAKYVR